MIFFYYLIILHCYFLYLYAFKITKKQKNLKKTVLYFFQINFTTNSVDLDISTYSFPKSFCTSEINDESLVIKC